MDVTWLCVALSVAVVIAVVLLVVTCVDCRKKGPMASITQTASEEYVPSPHFRVIHPSQPTTDLNSLRPPVSHPSPFPNRPGETVWQPSPYPPSETESNPSYENPGPESLESEADEAGSGYIIVIPEGQNPVTNRSGASTPSSDVQNDHDYVNIEISKEALTDYLNVDPLYNQRPTSATTATSDSDDDDDDDEIGNYVNQQPMIHS
ncbi:uncharacterized protein LOC110966428 isoform X2 [Acanthochromis polyacanthus]|uniref:uncharacterized protein LOC110966428 isoform X2 n=1 Tax=Acanthochromis polyacanthus TaxID=80966 RepID=UPI000B90649C|nr:uncharacterized protein LOC110966428 isoform X2 [Acanthochromis polyacanthus]